MWVEELGLKNIKCFDDVTIRFSKREEPYKWITFLSENGGGKSTALQALGLLLAGPESIQSLQPRPIAWLRDETRAGVISTRIHQGENDPGQHGETKRRTAFSYSFYVTGSHPISIRNRGYSEPTIIENAGNIKNFLWLRQNAFTSRGNGWFASGYGAFRRLTRSSQILLPSIEPPARYTNFLTLFSEDEPLAGFERWMVYLDYFIAKADDKKARQQQEIGIRVINRLLPRGASFDRVSEEGRVYFNIAGTLVPTIALSDGYRSVLALAGDLVWRLINAFPDSTNPLSEEGIVLIDELDIHLHPKWQRHIAGWLREQFPNLQFIIATHSPFIAAGAGEDALTLKFDIENGKSVVKTIETPIAAKKVDEILMSEAFDLVSPYTPQTQEKIDKYDILARKGTKRNRSEEKDFQQLLDFMEEARPFGGPPEPGSLEARMEAYLEKTLK